MEREKIIKLSRQNIDYADLEKARFILNKNYDISYGDYTPEELKKAIKDETPVVIKDHLIIGFNPDGHFINSDDNNIKIDKMVKAIIVEDEREKVVPKLGDLFAIIGKIEWENISDFVTIFQNLRVGEIFLPPHSAIFNFLNQTEKQKKDKIVSMLDGVNINVYSVNNYVDNCIHEVGHLFWRDCLLFEEKRAFKRLFDRLRPSAIYEYDWERSSAEEVFCTIYKWYLKSLLINKSFYNILEFEEAEGLDLLQKVFDRIAKDKITFDLWELNKNTVFDYLNPKFDITTGKFIRKSGMANEVHNIEIPRSEMMNVVNYRNDGIEFIQFGKSIVAVIDNKIQLEKLEKAVSDNDKLIYVDLDGVVSDFSKGYKEMFQRDPYADDAFTVQQFCCTVPNFFRYLEVLPKGQELYDRLKPNYRIAFLTTPMGNMPECKRDKIEWVKENFPGHDVIFSSNKSDYVEDEKSVLVDDMEYNLNPWNEAGGTAINFNKPNDKIIEIINDVFDEDKRIEKVKKQLKEMEVESDLTDAQKEQGNYKKGKIKYKKFDLRIENVPGSIRWGIGEDGKKWVSKQKNYYGYITGTEGNDYDEVDCYIGPKLNASKCFVINQSINGIFDEVKVMFGFNSIDEAKQAYLDNYQKGWEKNILNIQQTNTKKLRNWLKLQTKEPFE